VQYLAYGTLADPAEAAGGSTERHPGLLLQV